VSKTYILLLVAFVFGAGLAGMVAFKPLTEKERELQEQREQEIEAATDMGLVA